MTTTASTTTDGTTAARDPRTRDNAATVAGIYAAFARGDVPPVLDVVGTGRQVVAELQVAFELPNGGRFADEELHLFTFDDEGRVARFRHYVDTAKHIAAARGEDTTVR